MQSPPGQGQGYGYGPPGMAPGGPAPPAPKKGMSKGLILLIVVGGLFSGCVMCGAIASSSKKQAATGATATTAAAAAAKNESAPTTAESPAAKASPKPDPLASLPDAEKKFCQAVVGAAKQYKAVPHDNQLKRSKVRSDRRQALTALPANVSGWIGTITELSTNGEGKAALAVKLPCDEHIDVTVKTWNNAMSDVGDHTLIPQSSPMFDTLADLGKGKAVRFAGSFIGNDPVNGWRESSLSEDGSMTDPEFILRFSQVSGQP